jgi:hypothetical protein
MWAAIIASSRVRGVSFDADYQAVLNHATTLGYTLPSIGQQILQNQLVLDLKSFGIWSKLDVFYVFANDGSQEFATLNWKNPLLYQCTLFNTPNFTINQGFAGNATDMYINTNFKPLTNGVNYQQDSASYGYFIPRGGYTTNTFRLGARTSFNTRQAYEFRNRTIDINDGNQTIEADLPINGFKHFNRNSSTSTQRYLNGNLSGTTTKVSTLTTDSDFLILTISNNNTPILSNTSTALEKMGIVFLGGDLSLEASNFSDITNNYMTSLNLLLDLIPSPTFAYSLRKIRRDYTGNCIKVRRSSDNTTQEIGFVNDVLDTTSLLSFVGVGNGFVETWYDQSTNSNDMVQLNNSSQPQIVSSGSVILEGTMPTLYFDGVDDWMENSSVSVNQPFTFIRVFKGLNPIGYTGIENFVSTSGVVLLSVSTQANRITAGNNFSSGGSCQTYQYKYDMFNAAASRGVINGGNFLTGNVGTNNINNTIQIGRNYNSVTLFREHALQELILYPTNQEDYQSDIRQNINNYYNIF